MQDDRYVLVNEEDRAFYESRGLERPTAGVAGSLAVVTHDLWVEKPIAKGWLAAFRIVRGHGGSGPVIGEIRILPDEPKPSRNWAGRWSAEVLGHKARAPKGGVTASILGAVRLHPARALLASMIRSFHEMAEHPI
jgi:hypothetical protein